MFISKEWGLRFGRNWLRENSSKIMCLLKATSTYFIKMGKIRWMDVLSKHPGWSSSVKNLQVPREESGNACLWKVSWIHIKAMASQVWSFNLAPFLFAYTFVFQTLVKVSPLTVCTISWTPLTKGHTAPVWLNGLAGHLLKEWLSQKDLDGGPPLQLIEWKVGEAPSPLLRLGWKWPFWVLCAKKEGEGEEAKGKEGKG